MYRDDDVLVYMNIIAVSMAGFSVVLWMVFQFIARRRRTKRRQQSISVQPSTSMPHAAGIGHAECILRDDLSVREADRSPSIQSTTMSKQEIASKSLTLPRYLHGKAKIPATFAKVGLGQQRFEAPVSGSKPVEPTSLDLRHSWDLRQIAQMSDHNLQEFFKTVSYQDALFIISRLGVRWQAVMLARLHLNRAVAKKIKVSLHKAVS